MKKSKKNQNLENLTVSELEAKDIMYDLMLDTGDEELAYYMAYIREDD